MSVYYHGTSHENKVKIQSEGFKVVTGTVNGKHFGKAIYLTPVEDSAYNYGEEVVSVHIEDGLLLAVASMNELNSLEIKALGFGGFERYLHHMGYAGYKLTDIDGSCVVVVFDVKCLAVY